MRRDTSDVKRAIIYIFVEGKSYYSYDEIRAKKYYHRIISQKAIMYSRTIKTIRDYYHIHVID